MPSSRAISAIGRPLVRTSSTASRLNSGVNCRLLLRCCSGIWTASSHRRCPATGGKSSTDRGMDHRQARPGSRPLLPPAGRPGVLAAGAAPAQLRRPPAHRVGRGAARRRRPARRRHCSRVLLPGRLQPPPGRADRGLAHEVRPKVLSAVLVSAVLVLAATPALATPEVDQGPEETQNPPGYSEPYACTGYDLMATWVSAAGNSYTTTGNVCLFFANANNVVYIGAVARFRCYRNGVPYGGGGFG